MNLYHELEKKVLSLLAKKNLTQQEEYDEETSTEHEQYLSDLGYRHLSFISEAPELWPASMPSYPSYVVKQYCSQYGLEFEELYKLNSAKLRCDEFTEKHDGEHILFVGCSISFGDGVRLEDVWAKKVYNEIAKTKKTSGYFNLSRPGASNIWMIMQTYKYIQLYGIPDVTFLNFPDTEREFSHSDEDPRIHIVTINMYRMLKWAIESNGGRLISFSWDAKVNKNYGGNQEMGNYEPKAWFDNFYQFNVTDREEFIYEFCESFVKDNPDDIVGKEFLFKAMDDSHPGIAEHAFYAKFAMDIYNGLVEPSQPYTLIKGEYENSRN